MFSKSRFIKAKEKKDCIFTKAIEGVFFLGGGGGGGGFASWKTQHFTASKTQEIS